ncbi:MAG: PocR ligand-binding domain-containing protein, partial [Peptostreptococcaceae bacterium]
MESPLNKLAQIDEKYIEEMLGSFSKSTGLYVEGVDTRGKTFMKPLNLNRNQLCTYIRNDCNRNQECEKTYERACKEAFKWKEPYFFRCHAGVLMWAVPIILEGENIGCFICGGVWLWEQDDFFYEELREYNRDVEDFEIIKSKAKTLDVIDSQKGQAIANMLQVMARYLIQTSSDLYSEQQNLIKWKKDIRKEIDNRKKNNPNVYSSYEAYLRKEKSLLQYIRMG